MQTKIHKKLIKKDGKFDEHVSYATEGQNQ